MGGVRNAMYGIEFVVQVKQFFATRGGLANVRVINLSSNGHGCDSSYEVGCMEYYKEIQKAGDNGMLFVASAGSGRRPTRRPRRRRVYPRGARPKTRSGYWKIGRASCRERV